MAKEQSPDQMATRTFVVTVIGAILFITVSFLFITFPSFGR